MARGKAGEGFFSIRSADATEGGGIEGALATIKEVGYIGEFTYGGRFKDKPQAALGCTFVIDGFDKPWEQNYSIGPSDRYEVVDDGDGIRGTGKGLNKKSAAMAFFNAVESAAKASDLDIDELLPVIEGENCHSVRPLEGRRVRLTNVAFETVGGDKKELIVIKEFVDDAPKGGNGKASAKKSGSVDIETKTEAAVSAILEDETSIKANLLGDKITTACRKDPNLRAMLELCFKTKWVADENRPWSVDKKGVIRAKDEE